MRRLVGKHRLLGHRLKIGVSLRKANANPTGELGLGLAREFIAALDVVAHREVFKRDLFGIAGITHGERERPIPFNGIEGKTQHQGLQCGTGIRHIGDLKTPHNTEQTRHVVVHNASAIADFRHDRSQGSRRRPAIDPVPPAVVLTIAPEAGVVGKERIGPRIPCPGKRAGHIDHWRAIEFGHRIVRRIAPV